MNAIHGSLAKFAASRMLMRTPQKPVMSCLAKGKTYEMTSEGITIQNVLLRKPIKCERNLISWGALAVVSIFGLMSVFHLVVQKF